ncbi:ribonuclease H-like domain-containing protein [Mycena vitilis]|nr:ribonuclease H-like domain-containing protein [Mycena vitilis]
MEGTDGGLWVTEGKPVIRASSPIACSITRPIFANKDDDVHSQTNRAPVVQNRQNHPGKRRGKRWSYFGAKAQADDALRKIQGGAVGFDTEYTKRRPTTEEKFILDAFPAGAAARRYALMGWQIVELRSNAIFPVAWDNIGVRLIQLAKDDECFVLDMWRIKGKQKPAFSFPRELRRILLSPDITKVGVGLISDVGVLWDDLRTEMVNLVDVGLMARLLLAEKYPKAAYSNLSLKTSVEEVLGYTIAKELGSSDWAAETLSNEQKDYAALDAVASLRLHEVLKVTLPERGNEIGAEIPAAWYTFNTKTGEPTRVKRAADGTEIVWRTSDCTCSVKEGENGVNDVILSREIWRPNCYSSFQKRHWTTREENRAEPSEADKPMEAEKRPRPPAENPGRRDEMSKPKENGNEVLRSVKGQPINVSNTNHCWLEQDFAPSRLQAENQQQRWNGVAERWGWEKEGKIAREIFLNYRSEIE